MNVKKIFFTLGTIVGAVIIVAFALNVLMPNAMTTVANATEDMIYKATKMSFDFNGDGKKGSNNATYAAPNKGTNDNVKGGVDGFK